MRLYKKAICAIFCLVSFSLAAQDTIYVRQIIDTLSAPGMHGRGYSHKGDSIAASFIANEFEKFGLQKFNSSYLQKLSFITNTFPGNTLLIVNDKDTLEPFYDFKVLPISSSLKGEFDVVEIPYKKFKKLKSLRKLVQKTDFTNSIVLVDFSKLKQKELASDIYKSVREVLYQNHMKAKGVVIIDKNVGAFGVALWNQNPADYPIIIFGENSYKKKINKITIDLESRFYEDYVSQNVIGYIEGKVEPDSFFVIGAHYDHLGVFGKNIYFPGANDNASGIAAVLDLAKHFSQNQPYYSVAFMLFTGEEIGILGSKYYTENPLFPLSKIKFMFNLDMVGNGEKGIMAVNALSHPEAFEFLESINNEKKYFDPLKKRGEAANSDHHYFHQNKVPAFFFYTMGESGPYHHPDDISEKVSLIKYHSVFNLGLVFVNQYR